MYTKGKWEVVGPDGVQNATHSHLCWLNKARIMVDVPMLNTTSAEDKANAERICHCVNTYDELKAQRDELLEACEGLMAAFVHVEGDVKGNKARTDIFKHGQGKGGMAEAANKARVAIAKARC